MNEYFNETIKLAKKSLKYGDVPIGAIVVKDGIIIGKGYNTREKHENVLGHAEINAINMASKRLNNWNLNGCELYVTLKPCSMCMEIIKQSRITNVYYLTDKLSSKHEFNQTKIEKCNNSEMSKEYLELLQSFFKNLREKK